MRFFVTYLILLRIIGLNGNDAVELINLIMLEKKKIGKLTPASKGKKKSTRRGIKATTETSGALWNESLPNAKLSDPSKKIKILRYVDDKLYYTKDLSIFKKCDYNRNIAVNGGMKIVNSVDNCGVWINKIVVVNPALEVIEGQNTLVAAKMLNMGVYYAISEDRNPELLVRGEDATKWTDIASLTTYAKTNLISLKFLKYFFDVNKELRKEKGKYKNITLPQLLAIVYKQPRFVYGIKATGGSHVLNNLKDFDAKSDDILMVAKIVALAQKNCLGDGIKRYPFLMGLLEFIHSNKDNITVDLNKLFQKIPVLKVKPGKSDEYYQQIKTIYV